MLTNLPPQAFGERRFTTIHVPLRILLEEASLSLPPAFLLLCPIPHLISRRSRPLVLNSNCFRGLFFCKEFSWTSLRQTGSVQSIFVHVGRYTIQFNRSRCSKIIYHTHRITYILNVHNKSLHAKMRYRTGDLTNPVKRPISRFSKYTPCIWKRNWSWCREKKCSLHYDYSVIFHFAAGIHLNHSRVYSTHIWQQLRNLKNTMVEVWFVQRND